MPLGNGVIDHTHAFGGAGIDGAPAQHQVHGVHGADQWRQTNCAAKARMYTQTHFRQPEAGTAVIPGYPVTAGECQFQPATEAEAVDQGDAGERQGCQPVEHFLATLYGVDGLVVVFQANEFVDIGSGNKAIALVRQDDQTPRCPLDRPSPLPASPRPPSISMCLSTSASFSSVGRLTTMPMAPSSL